ncbi:Ycf66 family protein [Phormidium tenue FACHB-886]|nr:Ycf66 family protein [Phormidium tenue FACHB-886]
MLTYILALAVGLGSFGLYLSAFWFPAVYRKYDLVWSGVGLFYALVLWVCAGQIKGGVLIGQMASVALLGWYVWQTLELRWQQLPIAQRPAFLETANSFAAVAQIQLKRLQARVEDGSWKSLLYSWIDRAPAQLVVVLKVWQSQLEALLSTTFQPQQFEDSQDRNQDAARSSIPSSSKVVEDVSTAAVEVKTPPVGEGVVAEWDELEPESHPEMETMDSAKNIAVSKSVTRHPDEL